MPLATDDPKAAGRSPAYTLAPGAADAARDEWAVRVSNAVARGDHGALDALYREWFERAVGLARGYTRRDESFCLDIVQDAMVRAVRAMKGLPSAAALDGWMTVLIRSASIDALRREARRVARERARLGRGSVQRADEMTARGEELEQLFAALMALGDADAGLLRERIASGRGLRELAGELGATVGSVHGRVRRLLERLRERMREVDRD